MKKRNSSNINAKLKVLGYNLNNLINIGVALSILFIVMFAPSIEKKEVIESYEELVKTLQEKNNKPLTGNWSYGILRLSQGKGWKKGRKETEPVAGHCGGGSQAERQRIDTTDSSGSEF